MCAEQFQYGVIYIYICIYTRRECPYTERTFFVKLVIWGPGALSCVHPRPQSLP